MANIRDPWDNETINNQQSSASPALQRHRRVSGVKTHIQKPRGGTGEDIINNEQVIRACPACTYTGNSLHDTNCYICSQNLTNGHPQALTCKGGFNLGQKNLSAAKITHPQTFKTVKYLIRKFFRQSNAKISPWVRNCKDQLFSIWLSYPEKIKKFIILAVGVLLSTLIFGFALNSADLFQSNNEQQILSSEGGHSDIQVLKVKEQVTERKSYHKNRSSASSNLQTATNTQGLFSFGGPPFGNQVISQKLVKAIESENPNFRWRNIKSIDGNDSSSSIAKLIDGDLTVAFNARPLNDQEIKRAEQRRITLRQTQLAIEGLVFFTSQGLSVSTNLNLEQIKKIYLGHIKNWNQIDSQVANTPIAPIFQNIEDLAVLGIDLSDLSPLVKHIPDCDQLTRAVISTPGSLAFSSASFLQKQKLIKVFSLADGNFSKYVPPFINGSPNLRAFENGNYPLTRTLFVTYKEGIFWEQKAGEAYVNFLITKGQKIIEQFGFVPLR